MADEQFQAEGEFMKRYALRHSTRLVGTFDTAKETLKAWEEDRAHVRRVIDREGKYDYRIRDGRTEITFEALRAAARVEEAAAKQGSNGRKGSEMTDEELLDHLKQEFPGENIHLKEGLGIFVQRAESPQGLQIETHGDMFRTRPTSASTAHKPVGGPKTFGRLELLDQYVDEFLAEKG
jgi:hypothetical protein